MIGTHFIKFKLGTEQDRHPLLSECRSLEPTVVRESTKRASEMDLPKFQILSVPSATPNWLRPTSGHVA